MGGFSLTGWGGEGGGRGGQGGGEVWLAGGLGRALTAGRYDMSDGKGISRLCSL
jgi:hypothetical protein